MDITIQHNPDTHQFYAVIDHEIAHLDYRISADGKTLDYHSTFVPEELRGQQIAERIVRYALEYAKEKNLKVIPSCPYVEQFVKRHPEYNSIIVGA